MHSIRIEHLSCVAIAAAVISFGMESATAAQPGDKIGPEVALETTGGGPVIAIDPAGGITVAWSQDYLSVPSIFLRWYDAAGQPLAAPAVVNPANTYALAPDLEVNSMGQSVVTWQRQFSLPPYREQTYFRAYGADRQPLSPPQPTSPVEGESEGTTVCAHGALPCPQIPTSATQAAVALNEFDGVFVTWERYQGPEYDQTKVLYGRFFTNGLPGGVEMHVGNPAVPFSTINLDQYSEEAPDIAYARGKNTFGVTWNNSSFTTVDKLGAHFRVFDHSGLARSAVIDLSYPGYDSIYPKIVADPKGFVVAWTAWRAQPPGTLIVARRFRPDGLSRGPAFVVTALEEYHANGIIDELTVDSAGNLAVLFSALRAPNDFRLYLKLIDRNNIPVTTDIELTGGHDLAAAPNGDFLVVWPSSEGLKLQRFAGVGPN